MLINRKVPLSELLRMNPSKTLRIKKATQQKPIGIIRKNDSLDGNMANNLNKVPNQPTMGLGDISNTDSNNVNTDQEQAVNSPISPLGIKIKGLKKNKNFGLYPKRPSL